MRPSRPTIGGGRLFQRRQSTLSTRRNTPRIRRGPAAHCAPFATRGSPRAGCFRRRVSIIGISGRYLYAWPLWKPFAAMSWWTASAPSLGLLRAVGPTNGIGLLRCSGPDIGLTSRRRPRLSETPGYALELMGADRTSETAHPLTSRKRGDLSRRLRRARLGTAHPGQHRAVLRPLLISTSTGHAGTERPGGIRSRQAPERLVSRRSHIIPQGWVRSAVPNFERRGWAGPAFSTSRR